MAAEARLLRELDTLMEKSTLTPDQRTRLKSNVLAMCKKPGATAAEVFRDFVIQAFALEMQCNVVADVFNA